MSKTNDGKTGARRDGGAQNDEEKQKQHLAWYRETLKIIDAMKDEPLTNRVFVEGIAVLIERITRVADGRDCGDPECENEIVGVSMEIWESVREWMVTDRRLDE